MAETRARGRPRAFHDKTEQNTVQSLDRALGILRVLSDSNGLTLTELAQAANQSTATVYRVLSTFQTHGMVEMDTEGQRWHVGAGAFRVGSSFLRRTKLAERARGAMQTLMRASGETANLGIESKDEVLFLTQVETHEAIRAFFPPGTRSPMHVSGIGKALLAYYPIMRVVGIMAQGLPGFTPASLTDGETLEGDLIDTRKRGYAIDNEERTEGMRCIAAPIFNAHGEPVAGLSISGPVFRLTLERAQAMGELVRTAAAGVTEATGGRVR
ncbi:HTH-type transcriptional regulator BhcR [Roseinatronobacter monicus]|uniref:HTH-type transcriptional regulator BhcR n=1 Tax=Roseinatronobacter monicus TaxID=393481 RepID=UPI003F40F607